eukprot:s2293_g7.t1
MQPHSDALFSPASSSSIVARLLPAMFFVIRKHEQAVMAFLDVKDTFPTVAPETPTIVWCQLAGGQAMDYVFEKLWNTKNPSHSDLDQPDEAEDLDPGQVRVLKKCVGALLYLASNLPHCQNVVRHLATYSIKPLWWFSNLYFVTYSAYDKDMCVSLKWRGRSMRACHNRKKWNLATGECALEVFNGDAAFQFLPLKCSTGSGAVRVEICDGAFAGHRTHQSSKRKKHELPEKYA